MASAKATSAKEKGNEAFKAGDYPTAIGHYTSAILADSNDHTFYLNRAFAYLKLGKNKDAERDCTRVLALSPDNVKGLFRRAQARQALQNLEGAHEDLSRALQLEPSNTSVKSELDSVDKARQHKSMPKRRRVPIEIIEPEAEQQIQQGISSSKEAKEAALLQPVSSRTLKPDNKETNREAPSRPASQTFAEAKHARESTKGPRVSGGIFRPSGNHTIVTRSATQQATPIPSKINKSAVSRPPITLFDFTKAWESLDTDDARWKLMRTIPSSSLLALFQASLEPDLLKSILHTFKGVLSQDPGARSSVQEYMSALLRVQRFGTVTLFMDKQEKELLEHLRRELES